MSRAGSRARPAGVAVPLPRQSGHSDASSDRTHPNVGDPAPAGEARALDLDLLSRRELGAALAAGRLEAHFQPVVLLPSRHVVGFEALARLRGDDGRLIPPARFIPTAERSRHVVTLGLAMLDTAIAAAARWRGGSALSTASVSVNVAPAQLDEGFPERVRALLAGHGLPAPALVLEITESTATSEAAHPVLERLSSMGVRIALDDFGMGFANLDQLRRLPIHVLKLDRSFVANVTRRGPDQSIVRIVIELADALGLSVIGEGVETDVQAQALARLGCRAAQGFLFSPPAPDPAAAAAAVLPLRERAATSVTAPGDEAGAGWTHEVDAAVLAAARLLTAPPDRYRAALHAVAGEACRRTARPEAFTRAVARLALVHDIGRLAVDGALPAPLGGLPALAALAAGRWDARPELAVLAAARGVVDAAAALDPDLGPRALERALARAGTAAGLPAGMGEALAAMADSPPAVEGAAAVIEDHELRLAGRRGMEDRLRPLVGLSRALANTRDTRQLLRLALEEARRIVGAASVALERWERDTGVVRSLVNVGELGPGEVMFPEDEVYPLTDSEAAPRTLVSGLTAIVTRDDRDAFPAEVELLEQLHKGSSAAVPLYLEDRVWGELWFSTGLGEPVFEAADMELLMSVATLMSGVVAQAEHLDLVTRLAFEDPLTRLGNRRSLDDTLAGMQLAGTPAALAVIDVDNLQSVNDSGGTARGDEALCAIADLLSAAVAPVEGAVAVRLGGDEFCVVLPRTSALTAGDMLSRAATAARDATGVGFSFGLACATAGWSARPLLAEADTALSLAKQA